jgi:hypothetical protein
MSLPQTHFASWKMIPSVWRWPERTRLTPMAQVHAVIPLGALRRAIVHGKSHGITLS